MKVKRVNISLPEELLIRIDEEANKYYLDRSSFIRMGLERFFRMVEKERL